MKPIRRSPLPIVGLSAVLVSSLALGVAGCKSKTQPAPIIDNSAQADNSGADPAAGNLAPVDPNAPQQQAFGGNSYAPQPSRSGSSTQVLGTSQSYTPQQSTQEYTQQQQAPVERGNPQSGYPQSGYPQNAYPQGSDPGGNYNDNNYQDANATDIYADQAPPPLPAYQQPPAPEQDDLWTPGYWDYASTGYYWVPGAWAAPPYTNALWTPGYWGYYGNRYRFHHGFWGLHIGYYGGIDYGYGYIGHGYYGGYWDHDHFNYNRSVNNINTTNIHNVYNRSVVVNNVTYRGEPVNRVSYNGPGGSQYRPQPAEIAALREQHVAPMQTQLAVRQEAATNRGNFYSENHGSPQQAVYNRPVAAVAAPAPAARGGFGGPGTPGQPLRGGAETRPGQPNAPGSVPAQGRVGPQQQLQQREVQQQQNDQARQQQLQQRQTVQQGND